MPIVKNSRGGRSAWSSAKVSACFSEAYREAYGSHFYKYRQAIQAAVRRVEKAMGEQYGQGAHAEWPRHAIRDCIESDILEYAKPAVHAAFTGAHPRKQHAREDEDPVWSITGCGGEAPGVPAAAGGVSLEAIGERLGRRAKAAKPAPAVSSSAVRRSDWLAFMDGLAARHAPGADRSVLRKAALEHGDQRIAGAGEWFQFWTGLILGCLPEEPRLCGLLGPMATLAMRGRLGKCSWLAGGRLVGETSPWFDEGGIDRHGAQAWLAHVRAEQASGRLREGFGSGVDLAEASRWLAHERDFMIDWRGIEALLDAGALWPVAGTHGVEPPQWAMLRLAIDAAAVEKPAVRTEVAKTFYDYLSSLAVLSTGALREAGHREARYRQDQAGRVGDRFEAILDATHWAASATKWTGTVGQDWRAVRAAGASIAGRRKSRGVVEFWRSMNNALAAQGRSGDDRPVAVALPLWHREAGDLVGLRMSENGGRLQPVLCIPDVFFEKLRAGEAWHFLDPSVFPELLGAGGYQEACQHVQERARQHPHAVATVASDKVWKNLLASMRQGSPYLVFEGSLEAGAPFPTTAPPATGADGSGATPLPVDREALTRTSWVSGAVNLAACMGADGTLQVDALQRCAQVATRLLDNLTMLDEAGRPSPVRSIMLGLVGHYEAIDLAGRGGGEKTLNAWVQRMGGIWRDFLVQANEALASERGRAGAWALPEARGMGPAEFIERLARMRGGQRPLNGKWIGEARSANAGGRFVALCAWSPCDAEARLAGVTPGGIGMLSLVEDFGGMGRAPTPLMLHHLRGVDSVRPYGLLLGQDGEDAPLPSDLAWLRDSNVEGWERRLWHAAALRCFADQGLTLTLPRGLDEAVLHTLVMKAWWLGLNLVRIHDG